MIELFIVVFTIGFLVFFARVQQGSWLAPGAFFALLWFIYLLLPLLFAPDYPAWWGSYLWVAVSVFSLFVGSTVGMDNFKLTTREKIKKTSLVFWGAKTIIILSSLIGFLALFLTMVSRGFGWSSFSSIELLSEMGNDFSVGRYNYNYSPPFLARLLLSFVYFSCFLGGAFFAVAKGKFNKLISFLPFLPAVFFALMMTTRTSVIYPLIIWGSAYLSSLVIKNRGSLGFSFKKIFAAGILLAFIFISVVALSMLRSQRTSFDHLQAIWNHEKVGVFGSPPAFSYWFGDNWQKNLFPAGGAFTFSGFFDLVGLKSRTIGIYQENIELGNERGTTNVYTIFRGLAEDYTLPGSLGVLFIFGLLAGISFRRLANGERFFLPCMAFFYSVAAWSYFVNIFNYNSIIFGWLIFVFYVIFLVRIRTNG